MDEIIEVKEAEVPSLYREALIVPSSFREEDNTVEVVWTTGQRRRAYDWWNGTYYDEELEVSSRSVDMTRFEAGVVQVLDGHRTYGGVASILGIATEGSVRDGEGRARLKLSTDPAKAGVIGDIKAGIIRSISFGYSVQKYEVTEAKARKDGAAIPLYRATQWTPHEISFVTVPADPHASTRGMDGTPPAATDLQRTMQRCEFVFHRAAVPTTQEPAMDEEQKRAAEEAKKREDEARAAAEKQAREAEQARSAEITETCARHGLANLAGELIRSGASVAEANKKVLDELSKRDAARGGHIAANRIENGSQDEHTNRVRGIEEAVTVRMSGDASKLTDLGRQYTGMSLLEMGREMLEGMSVNTRGMSKMELAGAMLRTRSGGMMGTGDFPSLMSNVANKRLRQAYEENPGTYRRWARRAPNLPDFKAVQVTQFSAMPDLLQTNEHGEFKYGAVSDGAVNYNLLTYGRILPFTRQSMINDDLRAFERILAGFGASAARLENRTVYAQITSNPTMVDGVALFHATHGNLGGAGAIDVTTLGAGRKAMRKQKGLQNEELNLAPSFLLVPTDLEQVAYQYTSANYVPATSATINEFRSGGRTAVDPIVEPILDAASTSQWYLAANNSQVDTVEYAYLDGAEGVQTDMEVGFEVDGVAIKARLDFVAKVIDYRGLYRNG